MNENEFLIKMSQALTEAEIEFKPLTLETKIEKIELDSISKMMIIQMIDESYCIEITIEDLIKCTTIIDLFNMIGNKKK